MTRIARSVWTAAMFGVLVAGVQTLAANPIPGPTDPNPGANPDPDHCTYKLTGTYQYYCTYSPTECRLCRLEGPNTYSCEQTLCEFEEVIE